MVFRTDGQARRASLAALLPLAVSLAGLFAPGAWASTGYELDAAHPVRDLAGAPRGIAVDQTSQDIYVAIVSTNPGAGTPGAIDRFNSDLTADGVFANGSGYYTGVAVDPLTHGFYASQIKLDLPVGSFGTPKMDKFTSTGAASGSFALADAGSFPPIATDSGGRIFYPNSDGHAVEIFNSAGALQEKITCSGCPGGSFGRPISVALNAANDLYVADVNPDRIVKLTTSGGSYSYGSTLQSGRGAVAVGADPSSGDVLVGDLPSGRNYHIVAYSSSGTQFDDFGAGLFPDPPQEPPGAATNLAYQMAVNGTTHELYVGEVERFYSFEKTTIHAPTAATKAATNVGQLMATLNATVNAGGHATLSCQFEYTDDADTGFADATALPCPQMPSGSGNTQLSVKAPGLAPSNAYRYRVSATSNAGSVVSGSTTFETLPEVPPTAVAEAPTGVVQTAATLQGKVNPKGGSSSDCHFELGTSVSYGSSIPCTTMPGPVTTDVSETRKVTALLPATAYHYRLVITTNAGTTKGGDVEFTTASPPTEPEPTAEGDPTAPAAPIPPITTVPIPTSPPVTHHRRRRCKNGFHRRMVRGKVRCVRKKQRHRSRRHHQAER
jgi:hypothetical protein